MCILIEKIKQNLENESELFIQQLQNKLYPSFTTKFSTKKYKIKSSAFSKQVKRKQNKDVSRAWSLWSKFEEESLKTEYIRDNKSIETIAKLHSRTPSAIYIRLKKLSLIEY